MAPTDITIKNAELLAQLTEKLGLPLPDLVARGRLPEKVAAQMAQNCTDCPNPEKCKNHLASHPGTLQCPPSFCINAHFLTFLSKALPKTD